MNPAYVAATYRSHEELVGTPMFEAFPDNPNDPHADGVANLSASFEDLPSPVPAGLPRAECAWNALIMALPSSHR